MAEKGGLSYDWLLTRTKVNRIKQKEVFNE
jgi:hypothetical protein